MLKKILWSLLVVILLLVVASVAALFYSGAWYAIFPSSDHDEVAPELPADLKQPAVLLFTKTNGFRHKDGIAAGTPVLKEIAARRGWGIFHTENGAVFNDTDLARFSAVVFHNATGDMLSDAQELSFQTWMEAGGGWFGTHAAGDGSHKTWQWYMDNLLGAKFTAHIMGPQFQFADVNIEQPDHPVAANLPAQFSHSEEWYSWEASPRPLGFNVIATIDEDSYSPIQKMGGQENDLRMGDHPVLWTNCVGAGRSVYSTLGHATDAYDVPEHLTILEKRDVLGCG